MKLPLLALVVVAFPAFADVIPEDVAVCQGQQAGGACTTPDGKEGTCIERLVTRLDYSKGIPPGTKQVKMLSCQAKASAQARSMSPTWLGLGLAFLAVVGALGLKKSREPLPA